MMSLVYEHGKQCMPFFAKFSMILQTEILSTESSDFLKQIIFLKSFNSVSYLDVSGHSRRQNYVL